MQGDESSGPIDALIDQVARAMTAGEPSPRLRSEVADRIAPRPIAWPVRVWKPALAVAIVVVMSAALWPRTDEQVASDTQRQVPADVGPLKAAPAQEDVASRPTGQPRRRGATVGSQQPSLQVTVEPQAMGLEIESMVIDALEIDRIEPERVVLEAAAAPVPLAIEQLQIEPLLVSDVE